MLLALGAHMSYKPAVAKASADIIMLYADNGWKGVLRNLTSTQPELGPDITTLQVTADTSQSDILHISITDLHDTRWRVPAHFYPDLSDGAVLASCILQFEFCLVRMVYRHMVLELTSYLFHTCFAQFCLAKNARSCIL